MTVGYMPMPADFAHQDLLKAGRPKHRDFDAFNLRHPFMDPGKRAKIFSPFDALKGFGDAIASKDVLYVNRPELSEEDMDELNGKLLFLRAQTFNSLVARQNHVAVAVTWFVPCTDRSNPAFGIRGQYRTEEGICRNVDPLITKSMLVDVCVIPLQEIVKIEILEEDNVP